MFGTFPLPHSTPIYIGIRVFPAPSPPYLPHFLPPHTLWRKGARTVHLSSLTPPPLTLSPPLTSEIGGSNGPRHLSSLILQLGPALSTAHLTTALSRLAGFEAAAAGGGGLTGEVAELVSASSRRCAAVLLFKADQVCVFVCWRWQMSDGGRDTQWTCSPFRCLAAVERGGYP